MIEAIVARFKAQHGEFCLDVDLQLPCQGISAIYGPSGSGKTTLLRAMAGLDLHPQAEMIVDRQIWQQGKKFIETHHRPLGYVFQEPSLFDHLSVMDNLRYAIRRASKTEQSIIEFDHLIELLGIRGLLKRPSINLSGGEQRRVAIARALLSNPKLLLMDEPLAGLDEARKQEILPYLEALRDELAIPIIYVSHSPEEIVRLADNLVLLEAGKVLASGETNTLLTQFDLPMAAADKASAVVEAMVVDYDQQYQLATLQFAGGEFLLTSPSSSLPVGKHLRLQIAARDVSLLLEQPQPGQSSILNCFAGEVEEMLDQPQAKVLLRLSLSGTPILARITRKSADALGLRIGKSVFAQIKSVALIA